MGRRKITIRQITEPKLKHITFNKRKNGLIKKACELSLLCNVNMLLVFEDGAGNLVQFSRNRINGINSFFQECKYNNILELTSKEYPNFFKVNHYKKTKHAEKTPEDELDANQADLDVTQGDYQLSLNDPKQIQAKGPMKDLKGKDALKKQIPQQAVNPLYIQQLKAEMGGAESLGNDNRITPENPDLLKKTKGKPNLHLNIANPGEDARPQKTPPNDNPLKSMPMGDMNEGVHNPYSAYKKDPYQDEQSKMMNDKAMEYNASQFMQSNMDPLKRLSGVPEAMQSPFNFYPANNRLRPFNNFGLNPFANEDALNSMLKGYTPFAFPMGGNPAFMGKSQSGGEIDEKLLDTAKMQNYLNQAGALLNRHNLFNFPQGDFSKMNPNDTMRQPNGRNEGEYHNNYTAEEQHEDFPVMFKGDPRFESGLPPPNMNQRRYTSSDAYFNNFDEEYDKKKFKHN